MSAGLSLRVELISAEAFAPFGELVCASSARSVMSMNKGTAQRYFDLAQIDVASEGGRPQLSLCEAQAQACPIEITMLERHPLGSQAFVPVQTLPYLVVVATAPDALPRVFRVEQGMGVNYARGTWHHPLLALYRTDFWILDRAGPGDNCDEVMLPQRFVIATPASC